MQESSNISINTSSRNPKVVIVELGEQVLGGNEALAFTSELTELVSSDINLVVVDLHKVSVMNSSGLGMLAGGLTTMKKHNISLVLASVPDKIMSLLTMTHLDRVFTIYPTVEEAEKKI
jgi:anti-sigma B factor antagonist